MALSEVRIDAPVAHGVGIGQGVARHGAAKSHVVKLARLTAQARFDVAQTLAVRQLRKRHAQVLVEASELLDLVFPAIAGDATAKGSKRKMRHELRKTSLPEFIGWLRSRLV